MVSLPPLLFAVAAVLVQLESATGRLSSSPRRRRVRADDLPSDLSMPTSSISLIDGQDEPELLPTSRDVCISGGGPSGTYAAHLLQEKGYSVALFEKASMLGGKTVPIQDGVNMFRHVLTKDMTLVQSFIEKFGLEGEMVTRNNENVCSDEEPYTIKAVARDNIWENMALGLDRPGASLDSIAMAAAALRYVSIWNSYKDVIEQPNHDGVPEELMKGALTWLEENGIQAIAYFHGFYNGLSNYGYGFLDSIPIIYILKYLTPDKFESNVQNLGLGTFPFHKIFGKLTETLNDVHLDTRVDKLDLESEDGVTWNLHATNLKNGEEVFYQCDKVMIAHPPTEDALNIIHGLAQETKEIFSPMLTVDYWELKVTGLPSCSDSDYLTCFARDNMYIKNPKAANKVVPSMNIPNVMFQSKESDQAMVLYNAGSMDYTQEEIFDNLRGYFHAVFGYEPETYSIELYNKWPYFPHVNPEAMQNGFYSKVDDVQGNQNIHFVGGFGNFELVDNSMKNAADIVDKHFPAK